jgi:phosphoglycerol transferase MdoB-like AlkP superfamily enzyme
MTTRRIAVTAALCVGWLSWPYAALMAQLGATVVQPMAVALLSIRGFLVPGILVAFALALSRPMHRVVAMMAGGIAWVLMIIGCRLYFAWFGTIPRPESLRHVGNLPDIAPHVAALAADATILAMAVMPLAAAVTVARLPPGRRLRPVAWRLIVGLLVVVVPLQALILRSLWNAGSGRISAARLPIYDAAQATVLFGLTDLWVRDGARMVNRTRHPISASPPGPLIDEPESPPFAEPTGWNIVVIQVESLDPWVVDAVVGGRPVTPFLAAYRERVLWFPHAFAHHSGGGSADAELAALTSLLPLATHSGLITADPDRLAPLPRHLSQHGYATIALHPNRPSFYARGETFPRLGFGRFAAARDFHGRGAGWLARDDAFFAQAMPMLDAMSEPFLAYCITMQSHGPFTNHDHAAEFQFDESRPRIERDYLRTMAEVDAALATFITAVRATDWGRRTVIVLFSDHLSRVRPPAHGRDPEPIVLAIDPPDPVATSTHRLATHLDIAPTVVDLAGLPRPPGWLGASLLRPGPGVAVFNDLTELRLADVGVVAERNEKRMPYLLWSAVVLENRP